MPPKIKNTKGTSVIYELERHKKKGLNNSNKQIVNDCKTPIFRNREQILNKKTIEESERMSVKNLSAV